MLYNHPDVLDAAVVAQPDDKWGEVPCAFVELREGAQLSAEELDAWSRERLAGFKRPKAFKFGPLPKTSTGKVQKFLLRQSLRPYSTCATPRSVQQGSLGGTTRVRSLALSRGACAQAMSTAAAEQPPPLSMVDAHTSAEGIVTVTLTNGRRRNPMSTSTMRQLRAALDAAAASTATRAVVLQAEGPAFSAGHDLKELTAASALPVAEERDTALRTIFNECSSLMRALREVPVPVIAAVHGPAHAAGAQLAASCDIVVADRVHATFATPGVKIGIFCHTPAVAVVRALGGGGGGARRAAKLLYTGEPIGAEEAERIGLVHELAPEGEASTVAARLAATVATSSGHAVRDGKRVLQASTAAGEDLDSAWEIAADAMVKAAPMPHAIEGIGAFLGKRSPKWPSCV